MFWITLGLLFVLYIIICIAFVAYFERPLIPDRSRLGIHDDNAPKSGKRL